MRVFIVINSSDNTEELFRKVPDVEKAYNLSPRAYIYQVANEKGLPHDYFEGLWIEKDLWSVEDIYKFKDRQKNLKFHQRYVKTRETMKENGSHFGHPYKKPTDNTSRVPK